MTQPLSASPTDRTNIHHPDGNGAVDGEVDGNVHTAQNRPQADSSEQTQSLLENALENINEHFVIYDHAWRYVYVNSAAAQMLGLSKAQMIGQCIWELFPDAVGNQYYQELQRVRAEGITIKSEHHYLPWDRWFENQIYPIPNGVAVISMDITARKTAEAAQRQSEQRLGLALEAAKMVAWEWDIQENAITTSNTFAEIYGISAIRMAEEGYQLVHPDDTARQQATVAQAVAKGKTYHSEFRVIRPDNGQIVWIEEWGYALTDSAGVAQKLVGVATDVSERKRNDEALRESEARFRNLADSTPVMIWMTDPDARCTYLNQQWYNFTGQTPATALGSGWQDAVHPDDAKMVAEILDAAKQRREPFQLDYRFRRHDGVYRWAIDSATPRFDATGEYLGYVGTILDITERKEAEDRLAIIHQLSEAVNRAEAVEQIYTLALDGLERILGVDRTSLVLFDGAGVMRFQAWRGLSDSYRQQTDGYLLWPADAIDPQPILISNTLEEELGDLREIILAEDIQALAFIPLVDQGRLLGRFTLYFNQPHDFGAAEIQWVQTLARHVAHALQRKQAEEHLRQLNEELEGRVEERTAELQRSNRELEQFAYVASHDLKAPLRAINQLAGWIADDAATLLPPDSQGHLAKLQGRIRRMDTLLDDLLTYSRAGRQRHAPEPVDVRLLIDSVVEMVAPPAGFQTAIVASLPPLMLERSPLETILRNLIGNAVKHHEQPHAGQVAVSVRDLGTWLEFSVRDDGPGIASPFHARIFEMFQSLRPRDQVEGSGIGLALVKKHVESRGGTIHVESAPGEGATFRFTWPKVATRSGA